MRQWKKLMFYSKIEGIKPLPSPLGQNAFKKLLREASSSRPIAAYIHIPFLQDQMHLL